MRSTFLIAVFAAVSVAGHACASGQITPITLDGDWAAFEHSPSMTDSPDLCIAMNANAGFFIRIDDSGDIEFRLTNDSWSLPTGVTGELKFAVNSHNYSFDITDNTSNMVSADISQAQLMPVVTDMEEADSMQIIAGSSAPVSVSLDGSNQVLTALLTCSGISAPSSNTGGENPFSSSSNQ